jgi:predicted phosphodiesterase
MRVRINLAVITVVVASLTGSAACAQDKHDHFDAYVVLGSGGQAIARVITSEAQCPGIRIDGQLAPMSERAAPALVPQRPTHSSVSESKPADFPVRTCEYLVPKNASSASVNGQVLPLPPKEIRRIVVIGDTGCRLNNADHAWQACHDVKQYPFSRIAEMAARWHPDVVVHVGDYVYRENPCPKDQSGCTGSPWGYGADSWRADFFDPARPLLHAAPWIVVRGNHESCNRAGQGWWRFLAPQPLIAGQDCNVAANDDIGDFSDAYAVPLGEHTQMIVLDTSRTVNHALSQGDFRAGAYRKLYRQMEQLSRQADNNFIANHQPVLGFSAEPVDGHITMLPGNVGLQSVWRPLHSRLFPDSVDVLLSGHVHVWEQISFANDYPSQFVAGFSGTQEDIVPMPKTLPDSATPAIGAQVAHFSSWVDGFGYMTLERTGAKDWDVGIWNMDGKRVNTCHIHGKTSSCRISQVH